LNSLVSCGDILISLIRRSAVNEHFIPKHQFRACVNRYAGNYRVKSFSCFDQYLTMAFAQLTHRESLRDIETCLRALDEKLYRCGFRGKVSRNNLANANEKRDWRIYHDFAQILITKARQLYANEDFGVTLKNTVYALDTTVIDLCLSLFPWAKHRRHKSVIKLHTLMDLKGSIPTFIRITSGAVYETTVFRTMPLEPLAIYVMDKAYTDFATLYSFSKSNCFFIIRAKKNAVYYRKCSRPIDKSTGLRSDQTIKLTGTKTSGLYPIPLRRISFRDEEQHRTFVFLTNNFQPDALSLSALRTALADRTVLQMDQAALANKVFFRYFDQCCQDSDMDCDQCLRAYSDNQKRTDTFRENLAKTSTYGKLL